MVGAHGGTEAVGSLSDGEAEEDLEGRVRTGS